MNIVLRTMTPEGEVCVPSSKSYAHRALIAAFIANRGAVIRGIDLSEDIEATLRGLKALGAKFDRREKDIVFYPCRFETEETVIDAGESGSTLRFLFPVACYLCHRVIFTGSEKLFSRPFEPYEEVLKKQGISYLRTDRKIEVFSRLRCDDFTVRGDISSQFITGWMFLLASSNETHYIRVLPPVESADYIAMSEEVLRRFGVRFLKKDAVWAYSFSQFHYEEYTVEKDFSQFAFFAVLGALKGAVTLPGMNFNSLQGDRKIIEILMDAGAKIDFIEDRITFRRSLLKGTKIDLSDCIDLGPALFVLAAFACGQTKITGIRRLKYKESDRLHAMCEELTKAGVEIRISEEEAIIEGKPEYRGDYIFSSHNDHRIAMALAVFACVNEGTSEILGAECVKKSYPRFFDDLASLNREKKR